VAGASSFVQFAASTAEAELTSARTSRGRRGGRTGNQRQAWAKDRASVQEAGG